MKNLELKFSEGYIYSKDPDTEVMGDWEIPLMRKHAGICCYNGGDILEIGFGMALFATESQKIGIQTHTIVEIHPQILETLYDWVKDKSGVKIIEEIDEIINN
jgi:spermidine synthase